MPADDRWAALEQALREEFLRHNHDPTFNYEVDPDDMTVKLRDFGGGDLDTWLRYKVTEADLQQPYGFVERVYAAARRPPSAP